MIYVRFSDSNEEKISLYFASEQDHNVYDNLGQVSLDDARWSAYYGELPESAREGLLVPSI